jgi:hypothetical protein
MNDPIPERVRRRPLWPWFFLAVALAAAVASFFAYVPR